MGKLSHTRPAGEEGTRKTSRSGVMHSFCGTNRRGLNLCNEAEVCGRILEQSPGQLTQTAPLSQGGFDLRQRPLRSAEQSKAFPLRGRCRRQVTYEVSADPHGACREAGAGVPYEAKTKAHLVLVYRDVIQRPPLRSAEQSKAFPSRGRCRRQVTDEVSADPHAACREAGAGVPYEAKTKAHLVLVYRDVIRRPPCDPQKNCLHSSDSFIICLTAGESHGFLSRGIRSESS